MTWHFLFLALPGSALRPYNWPYSERYRWAKTCPGHRTAACGRSSPRAGTSAHIAVSAREGALPPPGSGEVFAGELARRAWASATPAWPWHWSPYPCSCREAPARCGHARS